MSCLLVGAGLLRSDRFGLCLAIVSGVCEVSLLLRSVLRLGSIWSCHCDVFNAVAVANDGGAVCLCGKKKRIEARKR